MRRGIVTVAAALVLAMLVALTGCGTKEGPPTSGGASPTATARPSPSASPDAMQRAVHADALQMEADIERVYAGGDAAAVNPYLAVGATHAFDRLVARGPAALDAVASEIEAMPHDRLYAYVLAIAGEQIQNEARNVSGASIPPKTWKSGKEWAAQYRSGMKGPGSPLQ